MGVQLLGEKYSQEDMGAGGNSSAPSYTETFYQCLPHYLVMGMSADEFWNCDPKMYRVYREKDRLENERKNELLWLAGAYTAHAIQATLSSDAPYPSKPFDLNLRAEEEEEHELTDKEIQQTRQFATVLDWAMRVNKQKEHKDG